MTLSVTASGDENQAATAVWAEQTDAQTNTVTVNSGATATLTITPVTGLGANANPYQQTFKVNNVNDPEAMMEIATITATVTVQDILHDLTPNPNETLDFATAKNGYSAVDARTITYTNASSLNLPSAVVIETTAGNMKAAVSWNVKGSSYRQSATEEQNFTVSGTITLPDGVDNDNNLNLATSIDVNVKAYSPKIASAENNIITGIDYNGVYTTQSKASYSLQQMNRTQRINQQAI